MNPPDRTGERGDGNREAPLDREAVLAEIRALGLPPDRYVVVGGAALAVRGIRDTADIDLVVTPSLFGELERRGWRRKVRPDGKPGLQHGHAEAYLDVNCDAFSRSIEQLREKAEHLDGVPFVDLETLRGFKAGYGRPKDLRDLELIEEHLA